MSKAKTKTKTLSKTITKTMTKTVTKTMTMALTKKSSILWCQGKFAPLRCLAWPPFRGLLIECCRVDKGFYSHPLSRAKYKWHVGSQSKIWVAKLCCPEAWNGTCRITLLVSSDLAAFQIVNARFDWHRLANLLPLVFTIPSINTKTALILWEAYSYQNCIFIQPRCPWGPIYGSWCQSATPYKTICGLNWCDSGWWGSNSIPTDDVNRAILDNVAMLVTPPQLIAAACFHFNIFRNNSRYWVNTLGPLCLWQCLNIVKGQMLNLCKQYVENLLA